MVAQRAEQFFERGQVLADLRASTGREASAAAIIEELQHEDAVSIADDLMPAFVKGVAPAMILRTLARSTNTRLQAASRSKSYADFHVILPSETASQIESLRDFAITEKKAKRGRVAVAFLGNEKSSLTLWKRAINTAGTKGLPVVFVRHTHTASQQVEPNTPGKTASATRVKRIPAIFVDGSDAVAIYRVACEAITRARLGRGPTVIECSTVPAVLPADIEKNGIYKNGDAKTAEPLANIELYLRRKGLWEQETVQNLCAEFNRDLDRATRLMNN